MEYPGPGLGLLTKIAQSKKINTCTCSLAITILMHDTCTIMCLEGCWELKLFARAMGNDYTLKSMHMLDGAPLLHTHMYT